MAEDETGKSNRSVEVQKKMAVNSLYTPSLRGLRNNEGWDQVRLAVKARVSPSTVYRLEKGLSARRSSIDKIASALGVDRKALISDPTSE